MRGADDRHIAGESEIVPGWDCGGSRHLRHPVTLPRAADEQRSDEQLLADYVDGDPRAFNVLFDRYVGVVTAMIRRWVAHPEDARELMQQTFLQMHRARRRFQRQRHLRPWLLTIAANLSRDHLRRRRDRTWVPLTDLAACSEGDPLVRLAEQQRVQRALQSLPPMQREVLMLQWLEGLSHSQIAERVGASVSAVKLRAFRGRAALREALGGAGA